MIDLKQGDCLELMKEIPNKSIDLILCDLPYGTTDCKWDTIIPFEPLWKQYNRIIKDNSAILLFSQMPFGANLIMSNIKMFRYEWIWEKPNTSAGFLNAKKMPLRKHENILVFYKHLPTYNPQGIVPVENGKERTLNFRTPNVYGKQSLVVPPQKYTNYPGDIIRYNMDKHCSKRLHPTQKPVDLLEYLIKTYTNEGDLILDNCMGSGSTGVACINTNRNFIGYELDENYFNIAKERIEGVIENGIANR